ncbi:MAG: type II toxin-antitoxin system HicA family toxin [Alphaproteobacteria bacterium]|nr:type II toxin-antitoxin system HicA family toxin [Alphaproteobacteria bacterium]
MKSAAIIQKLTKAGFEKVGQRGSHIKLHNPKTGLTTVVPHPKKDLPVGTVVAIERQTGVRLR